MITARSLELISGIDKWLDDAVADVYKDQPLAQDWARVAKIGEELGEAINELILYTGQNPRKGQRDSAYGNLLNELADTVCTAILAIQHFTKNQEATRQILDDKLTAICTRVVDAWKE